jgi:hypothetical protein
VTSTYHEFFEVGPREDRPYEFDDGMMHVMRYEMNKSTFYIERSIYGLLDWLGDLGGFNEGIGFVAIFLLMIL